MDFELLPVEEMLEVLKAEVNPQTCFEKIIDAGREKMPSPIWEAYATMNIQRDIEATSNWLNSSIIQFPNTQGIYLGLDTLNMEEGSGSNIEIGLSTSCNPKEIIDDWAYDCENYGNSHLIKGLYEVSDSFNNEHKWTADERSFAEYLVFLGYSGVILRDALLQLEINNDFLSVWGFHDGDMFFLVQQISGLKSIVTGEGF